MAGTNNYQIWNANSINQENDAAYTSDSLRVNGAPSGAIFPSPTANKLFFQLSVMAYALAQMMANKNYNVSDSNAVNLTTVLTNILTNADVPGYLLRVSDITRGNNSHGYWVKDNAGFIRQWGNVTTDINAGQVTVTFPIAFATASSISVVATTRAAASVDRIIYIINGSVNVNSFIVANNGSGGFAYWIAEGY